MAKRVKIEDEAPNSYFTSDKANLKFISSGCTLLDCALGGGFALGRMANVVGDKSTAKTGTATECLINFIKKYPSGNPAYREIEAAWDNDYAEAMGLPIDKVDFGDPAKPIQTVEDFIRDFEQYCEQQKKGQEGLYIVDSLDALSDEEEMEREVGEATYGMKKPKLLSEFFRKTARKIEQTNVCLLIISQVRDNIGAVGFGEKQKRAGGKAMDFYASQVVWFAHIGQIKRTIKGIDRVIGIDIRAKVKKNKVGMPFRECDYPFEFGYGINDFVANLAYLKKVKRLGDVDLDDADVKGEGWWNWPLMKELEKVDDADYRAEAARVATAVVDVWREVETTFLPKRSKYG